MAGQTVDRAIRSAPVLIVTDSSQDCLFLFRLNGDLIRKIGSGGYGHGQFDSPCQVAVSADHMLFVADAKNHRVQALRWDGSFIRMFHLRQCQAVALDSAGLLHASDSDNDLIHVFKQDGTRVRFCGFKFTSEPALGTLSDPHQLCIDRGLLYVANGNHSRIEIFSCEDGKPVGHFDVGGFSYGVCVDERGLIYTSHSDSEVRVWSGKAENVRTINCKGGGVSYARGLCAHDGMLYVGSWAWFNAPVAVFSTADGSFLRKLGDGVLKTPEGVTIVSS